MRARTRAYIYQISEYLNIRGLEKLPWPQQIKSLLLQILCTDAKCWKLPLLSHINSEWKNCFWLQSLQIFKVNVLFNLIMYIGAVTFGESNIVQWSRNIVTTILIFSLCKFVCSPLKCSQCWVLTRNINYYYLI